MQRFAPTKEAKGTVTLEGSGQVISIWLTEQGDSVLAAWLADDHR